MNVVYLILFYGIICFCMIIFNIFAILYGKGSNKINIVKRNLYKRRMKEQFSRIAEGNTVSEEHLKYLKRKLKRGNELMIYDSLVSRYKKRDNEFIEAYLEGCKDVLISQIYYYERRSNTEMAYYLSVIRDYNLLYDNKSKEIERILFETLYDESFYCRDNAYLAICKMGNPNKLCDALINISDSTKFFHQNLIFNGLSIYNGDNDKLIKLLMKNFDKFRNDIKCSIIEYLSYYDSRYSGFVYALLIDTSDRGLKISAIRYFENVHYEKAENILINYVNKYFNNDLEYCLASVKALRNYTSEESVSTIIKAIHSSNFKIRDMACESLAVIRLGIDAKDLEDFYLEEEESDMYNYHIRKNKKKVVE